MCRRGCAHRGAEGWAIPPRQAAGSGKQTGNLRRAGATQAASTRVPLVRKLGGDARTGRCVPRNMVAFRSNELTEGSYRKRSGDRLAIAAFFIGHGMRAQGSVPRRWRWQQAAT